MTSLLDVFVTVKPDMEKFGPEVKKKLARIDAKKEGSQVATRFGVGLNGALGSIVSRSAGIFAAGFATMKVGGFLKDAIGQASDLGETTSKVSQIFGPASAEILKFSKTSATALGQTQQAALDATATFGIFGKSAGLKGTALTGFTTKLTTLAGDLASFNNTTPEQAIEAIGAALRGETEPMRAYGVLLDDASLRQEALAQGLIKTTKQALTPQQKVLAAQALIMKQTTTAQGDFARTSGGLANQQRILSARFTDFKTTIGAVALPLATKFFGFLNDKGIPAITGLYNILVNGDFTGALRKAFGVEEDSKFVGFLLTARDTAASVFTEITGGFRAFVAAFKANDGDITSSGFPGFMERLGFAAHQAFDFFKTEVLPRLKDFAGFVIGNVVPAVGNLIAAFRPLAQDVGTAAVGVFQKILPLAKSLGEFIAGTLVPAFVSFTGWLKDNATLVGSVAVGIGAIVLAYKAWQGVLLLVSAATKAYAVVQGILNAVLSANPIGLIVLALVGLAAGLIYAYKHSETFRDIVNGVFTAVRDVAVGVFKAVVGAISSVYNWVKTNWPLLLAILTGPFGLAVYAIARNWDAIKTAAQSALRYVVNRVLDFAGDILDGAAKAFGWVPGLGDKLKGASAAFGKFRDDVNRKLGGINDQSINVELKYSSKGVNLTAPSSVGRGMATGGGVFGGVSGKDSVPALLMPDEHVWTTKEVAAAGGHGAMKRLRQAALAGELHGFANGGSPSLSVNPKLPSAQGLANEVASHKALLVKPYLARLAKALDGGVGGPPGAVHNFRGVKLNTRTIRMLGNAERMLGAMFHITQGSYSTRVAASGSTHAGGGAMDTNGPRGWNVAVRALRAAGFAAWHRTPAMGPWGHHIHSIALGDSSASPAAKAQMASFRRGGDGLGHGMAMGGAVTKKMARDMGMQIFDNGGRWKSGTLAANTSGKTETVVPGGDTMTVRLSDEDRKLLSDVRARVYLDSRELNDGLSRSAFGREY